MMKQRHPRQSDLTSSLFRVFIPAVLVIVATLSGLAAALLRPVIQAAIDQGVVSSHEVYRRLFVGGVLALVFIIGASVFWAYALGKRFAEPVERLTRQARRLTEQKWDSWDRIGWLEPEADPPLFDDPGHAREILDLEEAFLQMRRRLEHTYTELRRQNLTMEMIFRSMNDGVVAVDADGRVLLMTERADALLSGGTSRTRVFALGDAPPDALKDLALMGTHYAHVRELMIDAMRRNETVTDALTLPSSPELTLSISVAPLGSDEGHGAIAVIHDATRMVQLERVRRDFVANVTHELKTPLTSIRGYTELLQAGPRDPETQAQFFEIIAIETERLEHLIRDLLDLSAIESGVSNHTEPLGILEAAQAVVAQLQPAADHAQVEVSTQIAPHLTMVAEPVRFQQLLTNLVSNAIAYNRPGGTVVIRAREERRMTILEVSDTGIGIPEEVQDRIFERFYRVSKDRSRQLGGTGLGLAIVKHIVSLWGGTITVSGQLGVGSTFTVRIPRDNL